MKQLKIQPHFWEGLTQFNRLPSFHGLSFIPCFFPRRFHYLQTLQFFWEFSEKKGPKVFFDTSKKKSAVCWKLYAVGSWVVFPQLQLHRSKKKRRRHKSSRRGSILKWSGAFVSDEGVRSPGMALRGSWEHHRTQQKCL